MTYCWGSTLRPWWKLNRAVAIAMGDGPGAGLSQIEGLLAKGELDNYPLAHSAKAELCWRAGQMDEAKASFAEGFSTYQPGATAAVPAKPACRNKMKFCWRLLSILRVSRDYRMGRQKPTQMPNPEEIMKYMCFGYKDEKKWEQMSESEKSTLFDVCFPEFDPKNVH
jgi:hypothetical protein